MEYNGGYNSFTITDSDPNVCFINISDNQIGYYNIIGIDTFDSSWNVNGVKINGQVSNIPFLGSVYVDDIVTIEPVFERG